MNANKQDAVGLPELPEPGHYDDYEGEWYWTGSQMRAYGELCRAEALQRVSENAANMLAMPIEPGTLELCRAAPAGGDVPQWYAPIDFHVMLRERHWSGSARDELAPLFAEHCQKAFAKGYEKAMAAKDSAPAGSGEVEECLMSSEHEWTILDCPHCGRCVKYCKKAISSKEAYRDLTAEVTSLRAERDALLRKLQQGAGEGREGGDE